MKLCCVLISNKLYFQKMLNTLKMLINIGKYKGDICYIYGNDMKNEQNLLNNPILKDNKIILKYFPDLNFGIDAILISL